jgi:1,4-alpha-glucan branching enzyme
MMEKRKVISIVLNAHLPFVRHFEERENRGPGPFRSPGESWFFDALSDTYLPLLETFRRLDEDHVPFRLGISLSPVLCEMLSDDYLIKKYLAYTDRQIEFGRRELERTGGQEELHTLAKYYYDLAINRRFLFTERYERNILKALDFYQRKGRVEILPTAATHAFLPFLCSSAEAVQAQIEVGIVSCRSAFGQSPQGFWLPELGWIPALEEYLGAYNFGYTIVESHGLVYGNPPAEKGTFYPVKTPSGLFILARDYYAATGIPQIIRNSRYRDNNKDAGYDLPVDLIGPFLGENGARTGTGYKYWRAGTDKGQRLLYDPGAAEKQAAEDARYFLEKGVSRLKAAAALMDEAPLSLWAFDADTFGRGWFEGHVFLEALFREGARQDDIQFMTPAEYIYKQDVQKFQTVIPEFSSCGTNGYAETWLDASNDWMYRHLIRAQYRMIEMAERFSGDSGLKERVLNQAAREILLAQASDWPKMMYREDHAEFARAGVEESLRNFTTIYEALGSNYISTEWLTGLEKRHNVFPGINYRIFRRKK